MAPMLPRRRLIGFLGAFAALPGIAPIAMAQPAGAAGASARKVYLFNIPPESLQPALVAYINVVGSQIIDDSKLARNHQSSPVAGPFNADAALRMLLEGSDLTIVSTGTPDISLAAVSRRKSGAPAGGADGGDATLVLDTLYVDVPPGAEQRPDFSDYGQLVRQEIKRALTHSPETARRIYDVRIELWVDSQGCVQRPHLVRSSGKADLDASIQHVLRRQRCWSPPGAQTRAADADAALPKLRSASCAAAVLDRPFPVNLSYPHDGQIRPFAPFPPATAPGRYPSQLRRDRADPRHPVAQGRDRSGLVVKRSAQRWPRLCPVPGLARCGLSGRAVQPGRSGLVSLPAARGRRLTLEPSPTEGFVLDG